MYKVLMPGQHRRQMKRSRLLALIIALGAQGMGVAEAEIAELAPYSARIHASAADLVAGIRPTLDQRSAAILDTISFQAPTSWETNALADRGLHERRIVVFNAGLLAVTDWLTLAMIAENGGHEGCLREYSGYLTRIAGRNSRRLARDKEHLPMLAFNAYANDTKGACAGAHAQLDEDSADSRERILDGIVATVLLHEIAHHVLDHVDSRNRSFIQERMREIAADQWAIRTAVRSNYDLRPAVPLFLFLAASGGGTLEDDVRGSHPSGLRRVRDLLVQTRALLDETDPVKARRMDVSIADLDRAF